MPDKAPADVTSATSSLKPATSPPAAQPKTLSAPGLKRPVAAASVAKAKKAFNSFSLSKFADNGTPSNYVAAGQSPAQVQREVISHHINQLNNADAPTRAMTIALPDAMLKQLLPSLDAKARTIDLGEVMSLIQKNMNGTEFYANGNPTLKHLDIQSQVQQIIDDVKQSAKK
jgi:hypothetical protein